MAGLIYWFLLVSTPSAAALAVVTWRQRPAHGARYFTVAIVGVAWWLGSIALAYTVWLRGGSIHHVDVIKRVKWLGIFLIAGGIYAFGMTYTNRDQYVRPRILLWLAVVPVVVVLGELASTTIIQETLPWLEPLPLVTERSFWNVVGSGYAYLLLFVGTIALFATMITHRLTEPAQIGLWALAIGVPWTVNVGYVTGRIPAAAEAGFVFNPTPIGYLVTIVAGFVAILRYDAFQLAPVARSYVVDQLDESVVIYNDKYRLLDYNDSAASLLELTRQHLREDVRTVLADSTLPIEDTEEYRADFGTWIDDQELSVEVAGESVVLAANVAQLTERTQDRNIPPDYALVLQDVSERARRESRLRTQKEQLQLLNQLVHHDIRNDMNLILELLRDVDSSVSGTVTEPPQHRQVETLIESSEHVVELTETAHTLTNAVSEATEERKPVALKPVLIREVANASELSKDARVRIDGDIPDIEVLANEMLASVFRNLLTNAIKHNDTDEPRVTLRVDLTGETISVTVTDNGPGLPTHARQRLVAGDGSSSRDSGVGLSLVKTLVDQYDGQLSVESNDPRGTTITVKLDVSR